MNEKQEITDSVDTVCFYNDSLCKDIGIHETIVLTHIIKMYFKFNCVSAPFEYPVNTMEKDTCLNYHAQKKAIANLTDMGAIMPTKKNIPAVRCFTLPNMLRNKEIEETGCDFEVFTPETPLPTEFFLDFSKTQLNIKYLTCNTLYYLLIINNRVIKNDNSYLSSLNFFFNRKILSFEEKEKKTKEKNNELKNKILSDENFLEIIRTFSDFPAPAVTHNVNKITNTLAEAYSLYQHLLNGTFFDNCKQITEPWIVANKGDWSKLKEKKWKHKKIMKVLKEAGKPYLPDYYPFSKDDKKKILPKSLPQLFYNPFVKKCPSSFIRAYLQPPKLSPVQEITDNYPEITTEISQMCDVTPRVIIRAITYLEPFYNEICNKSIIFEDGKKYTRLSLDMEFSRHLGTFVKFLGVYVEWLGSLSEKWRNQQSVRLAGVTRGWFDEYLKKNYDIILKPNDSYLQRLARDLKRMKSGY